MLLKNGFNKAKIMQGFGAGDEKRGMRSESAQKSAHAELLPLGKKRVMIITTQPERRMKNGES